MKRKAIYLLVAALLIGSLCIGCGSSHSSDDLNDIAFQKVITEKAAEPKTVAGYFRENNLTAEGAGVSGKGEVRKFTFLTSIQEGKKDGKVVNDVKHEITLGIYEETEGDTKTISFNLSSPVVSSDEELEGIKVYNTFGTFGFVDRYTGICYMLDDKDVNQTTTINTGEKEYELLLNYDNEDMIFTITCPNDYDGAAFFLCGANLEAEAENEKNMDKFVSISEIRHDDYDMKFFAY